MPEQGAGPGLPGDVARALDDFVAAARAAFGDQLESVVLYGSAAEGALRATSDVNVARALYPKAASGSSSGSSCGSSGARRAAAAAAVAVVAGAAEAATDARARSRRTRLASAELAAGILANLDRVDLVEVIADDYVGAGRRELRALRTLSIQVPLVLHGISLGLASAAPVDGRRLDGLARVVGAVEPEAWTEHLAFVRAGGLELGHLAAPPRRAATLEGLAANVARARASVGSVPALESRR